VLAMWFTCSERHRYAYVHTPRRRGDRLRDIYAQRTRPGLSKIDDGITAVTDAMFVCLSLCARYRPHLDTDGEEEGEEEVGEWWEDKEDDHF
jgi:hypothetical protein